MTIEFNYEQVNLVFENDKKFEDWCDLHIDLFSGVSDPKSRQAFSSIFMQLKKGGDPDQTITKARGVLPPIVEEPAGRFLARLKHQSPELFKRAMEGWSIYGRGAPGTNQGLNTNDVWQLAILSLARASSESVEGEYLKGLIGDQKEAVDELTKTKTNFEEFMTLKSPADYWTTKLEEHNQSKSKYLGWLKITGPVFALLVVLLPMFVVLCIMPAAIEVFSSSGANIGWAVYPLLAVVTLFITLGLWFLRVLVKLFLSEHHLATDARERLAMVQTYHALVASKQASSDDRDIILSALFRPTQDGVVKDDGIDPTVTGLLSKALSR